MAALGRPARRHHTHQAPATPKASRPLPTAPARSSATKSSSAVSKDRAANPRRQTRRSRRASSRRRHPTRDGPPISSHQRHMRGISGVGEKFEEYASAFRRLSSPATWRPTPPTFRSVTPSYSPTYQAHRSLKQILVEKQTPSNSINTALPNWRAGTPSSPQVTSNNLRGKARPRNQ